MYEYAEVPAAMGRHMEAIGDLAKQGWELVSVVGPIQLSQTLLATPTQQATLGLVLFFKREAHVGPADAKNGSLRSNVLPDAR